MASTSSGKSARLPKRFPAGTRYIVEARGSVQGMTLMHRYVQFPDGRRVDLAARFVRPCGATETARVLEPRRSTARSARQRREARVAERVG